MMWPSPPTPTKQSVIRCGRGWVARRRVGEKVEYLGSGLSWQDGMGLPAECVVSVPFVTQKKAWGGVIAEAYRTERLVADADVKAESRLREFTKRAVAHVNGSVWTFPDFDKDESTGKSLAILRKALEKVQSMPDAALAMVRATR
jgi:hypothetical protein